MAPQAELRRDDGARAERPVDVGAPLDERAQVTVHRVGGAALERDGVAGEEGRTRLWLQDADRGLRASGDGEHEHGPWPAPRRGREVGDTIPRRAVDREVVDTITGDRAVEGELHHGAHGDRPERVEAGPVDRGAVGVREGRLLPCAVGDHVHGAAGLPARVANAESQPGVLDGSPVDPAHAEAQVARARWRAVHTQPRARVEARGRRRAVDVSVGDRRKAQDLGGGRLRGPPLGDGQQAANHGYRLAHRGSSALHHPSPPTELVPHRLAPMARIWARWAAKAGYPRSQGKRPSERQKKPERRSGPPGVSGPVVRKSASAHAAMFSPRSPQIAIIDPGPVTLLWSALIEVCPQTGMPGVRAAAASASLSRRTFSRSKRPLATACSDTNRTSVSTSPFWP